MLLNTVLLLSTILFLLCLLFIVAFVVLLGFVANFTGYGRDGVTWILNFTAPVRVHNYTCTCIMHLTMGPGTYTLSPYSKDTCVSQVIASANIKLCPDSGGQQCYRFLAPEENIEQLMDGQLIVSFPVHVQDDMKYNSMLYLRYETGQEIHSINSFLIGM